MLDCASIAAMTALRHFRKPDATVVGEEVTIVRVSRFTVERRGTELTPNSAAGQHSTTERVPVPLAIHHSPTCLTFAFFGEECVLSPSDLSASSGGLLADPPNAAPPPTPTRSRACAPQLPRRPRPDPPRAAALHRDAHAGAQRPERDLRPVQAGRRAPLGRRRHDGGAGWRRARQGGRRGGRACARAGAQEVGRRGEVVHGAGRTRSYMLAPLARAAVRCVPATERLSRANEGLGPRLACVTRWGVEESAAALGAPCSVPYEQSTLTEWSASPEGRRGASTASRSSRRGKRTGELAERSPRSSQLAVV